MSIQVGGPLLGSQEAENVLQALRAGEISGTCGKFLTRFEESFAAYCGCAYGIAVSSGSTALHLAMVVLGIAPTDEVLVSACTNIASGNAIAMEGGIVTPIDSEPDTWNMDVSLLERAITKRTKAIMPVHIYGHPVDMDGVREVAQRHHLYVVEDCAEAHGAEYKGARVGSLGDIGCFSFYANKIITCGEGGMLVTNDPQLAQRARSLRNLAFGTPRFLHQEIGFNYRMTNLQAAIGLAQLERIEDVIERKRYIAHSYSERLAGIAGLQLPVEKDYARNVYWMYGLVVDPTEFGPRERLMDRLAESGVETRTMFCPLNRQPALPLRLLPCPIADNLWENGLYLPSGCLLSEDDIDQICEAIWSAACV